MLFDELDVLSAVLREIFVVLDSSDVAFPSGKSFKHGLCLVKEVSYRELCCNLSVNVVANAYRRRARSLRIRESHRGILKRQVL